MNYTLIRKLKQKFYFTSGDLVDVLKIKPESAWVLASRYTHEGIFIRLKNNFYVLEDNWAKFSKEDFLRVSNYLQVPSYISLMTALSVYEITTQVQRNYFESVSLKRSLQFEAKGATCKFYKIKKQFYFDFVKKDSFFIATKEKAFVDSVYLYSFGKYRFDFDSLDLAKLDKNRLERILRIYPLKTKTIAQKLCKNS